MQLLKTKNEIVKWLRDYGIRDYILVESQEFGIMVNVDGDVDLVRKNLQEISVQFNEVTGSFNCSENNLKSLIGSPIKIGNSLHCSDNELETLFGSAKEIRGTFDCSFNKLNTLEYCPTKIGAFICARNNLKSLEYCPQELERLDCAINSIISLKHGPKKVQKDYIANLNKITTLENLPEYVGRKINLDNNPLMVNVDGIYNLTDLLNKYKEETIIKMKDKFSILLNESELRPKKKNKI